MANLVADEGRGRILFYRRGNVETDNDPRVIKGAVTECEGEGEAKSVAGYARRRKEGAYRDAKVKVLTYTKKKKEMSKMRA